MQIYTIGYGVPGAMATLENFVNAGGFLFDIRFSPSSANPIWRRESLQTRFGDAYRHVKALGNKNFRGGPIEIVDFAAGRKLIEAQTAPVVLMCVCKNLAECHRMTVTEMLVAVGHTVNEVEYVVVEPKKKKKIEEVKEEPPVQPTLWG